MSAPGTIRGNPWPWLRLGAIAVTGALAMHLIVRVIDAPQRWKWWFFTANDLGCVMAAVLCLGIGAVGRAWGLGGRWRLHAVVAAGGVALTAGTALVASCSRGGWVALLVGTALMASCCRHAALRRGALVAATAITLAVLLTPKAQARANTLLSPFADGSTQARVEMWTGATALIADHPLGCGVGRFGAFNEDWYLPRYRGIHLFHALNDTLFIGAERGIACAWLYLAGLLGLISALALAAFRHADPLDAALAGGLATLVVGGAFTSLVVDGAAVWIGGLACAAALRLARGRWALLARGFAVGGVGASLIVGAVLAIGLHNADALAYRPTLAPMPTALPRHRAPRASVVVLRGEADGERETCEHVLRHLAGSGFRVVTPGPDVDGAVTGGGADDLPVILLAMRGASDVVRGGWRRHADARAPLALILLDPVVTAADAELLPSCPVLVCQGTFAARQSDAQALAAVLARHPANRRFEAEPFALWPRYYPRLHDRTVAWILERLPPDPLPAGTR